MKAVQVSKPGGPEALELVDLPVPVPGPGQVQLTARAFGVSTPDALIRSGVYKWMPPLPANPGNDVAGIVTAVGPGVTGIEVGSKALLSARDLPMRGGCYAEVVVAPADAIHPLAPRSVLVVGAAGGIGSAIAQLAKREGLRVLGTVSSEEKAAFARRNGVDEVIFYRTEPVATRVRELTGDAGVGRVFEHAGGPGFVDLVAALGDWGTLVSYNGFSPLPAEHLTAALRTHMAVCPGVRQFSFHYYDHQRDARRALMRTVIDALTHGEIAPAIWTRLPFSEVRRAHELLASGAALGKIVMTPDTPPA